MQLYARLIPTRCLQECYQAAKHSSSLYQLRRHRSIPQHNYTVCITRWSHTKRRTDDLAVKNQKNCTVPDLHTAAHADKNVQNNKIIRRNNNKKKETRDENKNNNQKITVTRRSGRVFHSRFGRIVFFLNRGRYVPRTGVLLVFFHLSFLIISRIWSVVFIVFPVFGQFHSCGLRALVFVVWNNYVSSTLRSLFMFFTEPFLGLPSRPLIGRSLYRLAYNIEIFLRSWVKSNGLILSLIYLLVDFSLSLVIMLIVLLFR